MDNSPSSDIWVSELNARTESLRLPAFNRPYLRHDSSRQGILSSPLAGPIGDVHHFFSALYCYRIRMLGRPPVS